MESIGAGGILNIIMESIGAGGILMPLYALISWYGLIKDDNTGEYILQVSLVGWLWAVVNTYNSELK